MKGGSIFIKIFLLTLLFEGYFSIACYTCKETEYSRCKHPDNYYPPVAFCGATSAQCGIIKLKLAPRVAPKGQLWLSFGDESKWAVYKGCVSGNYCITRNKTHYQSVGADMLFCKNCAQELCNSTNSNLISFSIVTSFFKIVIFYFLKSKIYC